MIFLYLMICSIQKKMIATTVGALRSYGLLKYVTTSNIAIFCILNTKSSMYQVIQINKTFTSLGASHITGSGLSKINLQTYLHVLVNHLYFVISS